MAWWIKYQIDYTDRLDVKTRIVMLVNEVSNPGIEYLIQAETPLLIQLQGDGKLFNPVQGSGATINFLLPEGSTTTPRDFYTADPHGIKVRIEKDTDDSGNFNQVLFIGWVNTEIYEEDFTEVINQEVILECNDGISTLDRYDYANGYGSDGLPIQFDDEITVSQILKNCIDKMELGYLWMYYASYLKYDTQPTQTLIESLKVQERNYYNEKGEAMTYKKVLEAVLRPLNLTFFIESGKIYILDLTELPSTVQPLGYEFFIPPSPPTVTPGTVVLLNRKTVEIDFEFHADDTKLTYQPGVSQTTLKYNPFNTNLVPFTDWDKTDSHKSQDTLTWVLFNPLEGDDYYNAFTPLVIPWFGVTGWSHTLGIDNSNWKAIKNNEDDKGTFFYEIPWTTDTETYPYGKTELQLYSYSGYIEPVHTVAGQSLKVTCKGYFRTKNGYYNVPEPGINELLQLWVVIKVGGTPILDGGASQIITYQGESQERATDGWVDMEILTPIVVPPNQSGDIEIEFYDRTTRIITGLKGVGIKDVNVQIVAQVTNEELDSADLEYISKTSVDYINKGQVFDLKHGDSALSLTSFTSGIMSDRGGFIDHLDNFATLFSKQFVHPSGINLQEVFLDILEANNREPRLKLSGSLSSDDILIGDTPFSKRSGLSFAPYINDKIFTLVSGEYDDQRVKISGTWLETHNELI